MERRAPHRAVQRRSARRTASHLHLHLQRRSAWCRLARSRSCSAPRCAWAGCTPIRPAAPPPRLSHPSLHPLPPARALAQGTRRRHSVRLRVRHTVTLALSRLQALQRAALARPGYEVSGGSLGALPAALLHGALEGGGLAQHVAGLRRDYARSTRTLCQALREAAPSGSLQVHEPAGGYFVWCDIVRANGNAGDAAGGAAMAGGERAAMERLSELLARHGVGVLGGARCVVGGSSAGAWQSEGRIQVAKLAPPAPGCPLRPSPADVKHTRAAQVCRLLWLT